MMEPPNLKRIGWIAAILIVLGLTLYKTGQPIGSYSGADRLAKLDEEYTKINAQALKESCHKSGQC